MKVYNLGSLNIDYVYTVPHFVSAKETLSSNFLQVFPGGKGLNQSVALAKAGIAVIHGAIVGDSGQFLLDTLSKVGGDVSRIQQIPEACGHAIIQVDPSGQNCILLYAGTNHKIDRAYIETFLQDAQAGDFLLLQNETSGLSEAFEIAHRKGMQIVFNPSPLGDNLSKLPLSYVTWWFCNEVEGEALFGSARPDEILANFGKIYPHANLVLTLGAEGSICLSNGKIYKQSIYPVQAVDTTAAGDTYTGYFIASIARGCSLSDAMKFASKASGISVSRMGAAQSIPYLKEVQNDL